MAKTLLTMAALGGLLASNHNETGLKTKRPEHIAEILAEDDVADLALRARRRQVRVEAHGGAPVERFQAGRRQVSPASDCVVRRIRWRWRFSGNLRVSTLGADSLPRLRTVSAASARRRHSM